MAVRRSPQRATNKPAQPQRKCRDCAHSYDWCEKGHDGKPFLCRCPFKQQGGKFCIFLSDNACEKFVQRKEGGPDGK